jgi:AcrR family transcriptional regulator
MYADVQGVEATARTSRRETILEAAVRVFGQRGYRATTVANVIAEAGVSRTTFYKHFADKHECFLATYELAVQRVLAAVEAECEGRQLGGRQQPSRGQRAWLEQVRCGLTALIDLLVTSPELARVAVVEGVLAGAKGRQRQLATVERFAHLLDTGHEAEAAAEANGGRRCRRPELPANTGLMATSAVVGLLFDEIQAGRAADLPQYLPGLLFALLVPYVGPRAATEEMQSSLAYSIASR